MCLFCCPCSGQESCKQDVFGCWHSPHWERHSWLSGTSHGYQEGKALQLNQQLLFGTCCCFHLKVTLLAFTFCKFPNSRVRRSATSASLNLLRKPSQVAPFATRPQNPFTALCGPNTSSSKFSTLIRLLECNLTWLSSEIVIYIVFHVQGYCIV